MNQRTDIDKLFESIWQDYVRFAPSAPRIHALLGGGAAIINDHIALRSVDLPGLGIAALARPFLDLGFEHGGDYRFEAKKLTAHHYQHPDPHVPKVFISELKLDECSVGLRERLGGLIESMDPALVAQDGFVCSGRHWRLSQADYAALLEESEYAAWLAAFGFRANHFTVSVNQLEGFDSVDEVNAVLKLNGFALNCSGGEVKGGPEVLLAQSSTLADRVTVDFSDGAREIPGCFYEFAYRYPQADGTLYQGFVEASADKIFESTHAR